MSTVFSPFTLNLWKPLASITVPKFVPFIRMDMPEIASPIADVALPIIVLFYATALVSLKKSLKVLQTFSDFFCLIFGNFK